MSILGDQIRAEAAMADRWGQLARLEAIAAEVDMAASLAPWAFGEDEP